LFAHACRAGIEGVISKVRDSGRETRFHPAVCTRREGSCHADRLEQRLLSQPRYRRDRRPGTLMYLGLVILRFMGRR
jgi:hypothetical protein